MYDFEDSSQIVSEIQLDLGFNTEKMRPHILRWMYRAVQSLGVAHGRVLKCEQNIEDLSIEKPSDYLAISHIYLGENCIEPIYDDIIECCPIFEPKCNSYYRISENETHFNLGSESKEFEKAELIYHAAPLDNDGLPLVPYYSVRCVKAFVRFKYLMWKRDRHRTGSSRRNPVPQSEINSAEARWLRRQGEARGIQNAPQGPQQAKQVGAEVLFTKNTYPQVYNKYKEYLKLNSVR